MLLVCLTVSLTIISFLYFGLIFLFLLYCKIVTSKKAEKGAVSGSRTRDLSHLKRESCH